MGQWSALSTSTSLIRQVRDNEPQAWERLSTLYASMVFAWCRASGLQSTVSPKWSDAPAFSY